MPQPAVFLDRDGTLIEDLGVLSDPSQIHLFDYTLPALAEMGRHYLLFVVTNQNGIATGQITFDQARAVNAALDEILRRGGVSVRQWYVCPHHRDDGCACIKPNPTFLRQAARDWDVDLRRSYVIGDHPHDAATADGVGATGLYLLTGHGRQHQNELPPGRLVFDTLASAGEWLMRHKEGSE